MSRSTDADRLRALEHAYHSLDKLYRDQIKTLSRVGKGSSIFDLAFLVASCTGRDFPAISLDEIVHAAWLLDSTYTSSTKLTNLNGGLFPLVDLFLRKRIFKRGAYGPRVTVVEFTHFTVLELLDDALEALTTNGTYWRQTKALATSAARERAVMSHLTEASLRLLNAPDFNIPLGDAVTELRALRSRTEQLPLYAFAVQSGLRTARSVLSLNSGWDEDNATKFNHENIEREVERLLCDPVQRNNLISWLFAHAVSERHMLGMLSASQFKQSYDDMFYVRLIERLAKLPSPSVHVAAALGFLRQLRSILYPGLLSFWRESSSLLLNTISPIFGHPLHAAVLGVRCLQYDGIAVAVMVEGANACSQLHSQLPDASDTGFLPQSRKTEAHARSTSPFAGALCFQSIGQEDYSAAGRTLGALLVSGANASLADDEMSRFAKLSCQRHSEHDATLVGTDGIRRECPGCSSPPIDMRTLALGVGYMSGNVEVVVKMIQSHARGSPSGRMEPLSGSFFSALSAIAADGDLSDAIKGGSTTPGDSSDLSRGEFLQGVCLEILAWAVCKLVSPGSEHEDDDEMEELGDDELEPVCADMFAQVYAFMVKHRLPAIDDIQLGWKHRSSDFCIPGVSDRYLRRVFLTYWNAMPDSDEYYAVLYYLGRDGRYDANMKPPKRKAERTSNQTMLFLAAETGATATALALVETGADVNQRDAHGRTPIMFVENATMLHRLLDLGADIEARDDEGRTLWHVVAATNDENLAGHLVAIYSMPDGNGTQRGDGAPNVVGSSGRSARFTASAAVAALEVRAINGRTPLCEALCNPQRGRGSFGEREADDEIEDEVYSTPSAASILLTYCDTPECFERGYDDILMLGEMAVAWFPRRRREPQPAKALLLLLSELVERASIAGVPDTEAAILGSSTSEARRLYERFCKNAG